MPSVYSCLAGGLMAGVSIGGGVLARRLALGYQAALETDAPINMSTFLSILGGIWSRRGWAWEDWASGALIISCVALSLWLQGDAQSALASGLACSVLWCLAVVDMRTGLLPDVLTMPLLGLGVWIGPGSAWEAMLLAAITYLCGRGLAGLYERLRGQPGMGGGDIKLMAALATWTGAQALIWIILCASLLGVFFAMCRQGRWVPRGAYPFGPFLALAATPVLVVGGSVHSWF